MQAQSQLEVIATQATLDSGVSTGRYPRGGQWRLTVAPLAGPDAAAEPRLVTLDAFDARGRQLLRLRTVKLVPVAQ